MGDWDKLPDKKTLEETVNAVNSKGINVIVAENREDALKKLNALIPKGSEVMTGSSTTLTEIGFMEYLKSGSHGWNDLHHRLRMENDAEKRAELRRKTVTADYFLGSVNAIAKTGELVAVDNSGSRVGAYPFAAKRLLLVAGAQKITPTLNDAMKRVREYVFPIEDKRAKEAYGMASNPSKWVIIEKEIIDGRTSLILVKEKLGF